MSQPKPLSFRPGVLQLEAREVPAVASALYAGGVVTVQANNGGTTVLVVDNGVTVRIQDTGTGKIWSFAASQVNRVDLIGGNGGDTFTARGDVRVRMFGNGGNDTFYGAPTRDVMLGGAGQDRMFGRNGNDHIDGGDGNDNLNGGNGNDALLGGNGTDQLNGGLGADALSGDTGEDVLVAIDDSTADTVDGGGGRDILWLDQVGVATDAQVGADALDFVNAVAGFANSGADRTLTGDNIPDPALLPNTDDVYERFADRPLFASQGPTLEDFSQGQLGDCWFLAALGSTVQADQTIIESRVVDFGDGTYGVRYESQNGTQYYRVDNELPVASAGNTFLEYTAVGLENSVWVAVMEKAYTHHRVPGANSYASIEGGFSFDAFPDLGLDPQRIFFDPTSTLQEMSDTIKLMVGPPLTAGTVGLDFVPAGVPLIAAHQYVLLGYEVDPISDLVETVILRNPWGIDGPGTSPGPFNDNNFEDGVVRVSLSQLRSCQGSFEWAPIPA
jgi:hypothetical protein